MLLIDAGNIKKYYGDRLILDIECLKIYRGDKIGIVGANGIGKSTFLNILAGELQADEGYVKRYTDFAYIRQLSDEPIEAGEQSLKEFELVGKIRQEAYSGGEKTRIKLANAFTSQKPLLFADEPTSNLDYKGILTFREKLHQYDTFLLVSHDRGVLEDFCTSIIELSNGRAVSYSGSYSFYIHKKQQDFKSQEQEYEKYIVQKNSLEAAIVDRGGRSKNMRKAPKRMGNSEARLHKRSSNERKVKLDNAVNSFQSRLERLERKEKPKAPPVIKLDFSLTQPPENRIVIEAEKLNFSYGSKVVLRDASFRIYNGQKTAIWGANGSGKTTILNLIAFSRCDAVRIVPKVRIGYFRQGFETLDLDKTVLENVMRDSVQSQTTARTILARLLISGDNVHKKAAVLSGGERIKTAFAAMFVSNANVLLLDEPVNYLDLPSIEALERVLKEYQGTVLFVAHDKDFVNAVADRLIVLDNSEVREFNGSLGEYEECVKALESRNDARHMKMT